MTPSQTEILSWLRNVPEQAITDATVRADHMGFEWLCSAPRPGRPVDQGKGAVWVSVRDRIYPLKALGGLCVQMGLPPQQSDILLAFNPNTHSYRDLLFQRFHFDEVRLTSETSQSKWESSRSGYELTQNEERRIVNGSRAVRVRQAAFRTELLNVYSDKCAVTGNQPACTLEAAHIWDYSCGGPSVVGNGLLLRADIHALFDADMIRISMKKHDVSLVWHGNPTADYAQAFSAPIQLDTTNVDWRYALKRANDRY